MNQPASHPTETETAPGSEGSGAHGHIQLVYQPAVPVPKGKLAVWLFLSTEIMFFTALIGTYIVLRFGAPKGSWPTPHEVRVVEWLGALNTFVLICSSVTIVFALETAKRDLVGNARKWLFATFLLGCVFLGIKAYEYNSKFAHGIHPSVPRSLLYDRADLQFLAGMKASCDEQINLLEKGHTAGAADGQPATETAPVTTIGNPGDHGDEKLEQLKLVRSGLVQWTQQKVGHSGNPMMQELALLSLAHQIYPRGENERVDIYLADDLAEAKESHASLEQDLKIADRKTADLQKEVDELTAAAKKQEPQMAQAKVHRNRLMKKRFNNS